MGPRLKRHKQILTINAGSSSIKLVLFAGEPLERTLEADISNIGQPNTTITIQAPNRVKQIDQLEVLNHRQAITALFDRTQHVLRLDDITAIGHRLVHGGPAFAGSTVITPDVVLKLKDIANFDPMHTPMAVELIEAFAQRLPHTPQIACFDTTFYARLPAVAKLLPLPRKLAELGIRRYGFHGLSYTSLTDQFSLLAGEKAAQGKIIMAHLGSGASLTAMKDGKVVDTTMSFTPASGIPMSCRSGDIDPSIVDFICRSTGMSVEEFDHMVNFESGLLGVSELSPDMELLINESGKNKQAREAVELFCYSVRKTIGALTAAMGGLDSLIFSGGIGEKSWIIRSYVCGGLEHLGLELDEKRNKSFDFLISSDKSRVGVHMLHSDEARVLARETEAQLSTQAKEAI